MPITTKHLSEVTTSGVTGFGGSAGTPANFANPDDANLFSQITANMDSAAADSRAFNRIALTGLNDWIPASTITHRKIIIRYRQTLTSIGDAPADCEFISGYKYSLNGGGAFTTVQVLQTGPNLNYDSGILVDEITLPGGQDISQIIVEAFAEVNKTSGGGTASASHADIQAFHAYVETYEDLADLMVVRPNAQGTSALNSPASTHQETTNSGNAWDDNLTTFADHQLEHTYTSLTPNQHNYIVRYDIPLIAVPTRIIDAVIRFRWSGELVQSSTLGVATVTCTVETSHSSNGGVSYTPGVGSKFRITNTIDPIGSGTGPFTTNKTIETVYYRFATPNVGTDKMKLLVSHITIASGIDVGDIIPLRAASKFYEVWAELRIESSQEGGAGWVDL